VGLDRVFWVVGSDLKLFLKPPLPFAARLFESNRWMQVQSYTRACPVCKAGVEVDKVRARAHGGRTAARLGPRASRQQRQHTITTAAAFRTHPTCAHNPHTHTPQVIPIYGRGSDFDPRQAEAIKVQPVPPRPAGQRPTAVAPGAPPGGQQGVLPALFGFQLGPGQGYVEALTPEQQHQVRAAFWAAGGIYIFGVALWLGACKSSSGSCSHACCSLTRNPCNHTPHTQAFLSRLLLMLGSFVIMCLLLF